MFQCGFCHLIFDTYERMSDHEKLHENDNFRYFKISNNFRKCNFFYSVSGKITIIYDKENVVLGKITII